MSAWQWVLLLQALLFVAVVAHVELRFGRHERKCREVRRSEPFTVTVECDTTHASEAIDQLRDSITNFADYARGQLGGVEKMVHSLGDATRPLRVVTCRFAGQQRKVMAETSSNCLHGIGVYDHCEACADQVDL